MADIINLRRVRKAKARADRAAEADANRILHGLGAKDRRSAADDRTRAAALLDGHRRDTQGPRDDEPS